MLGKIKLKSNLLWKAGAGCADEWYKIPRSILYATMIKAVQNRYHKMGHVKFFLEGENWSEKISFTATSTSGAVRIKHDDVFQLKVLINARVRMKPEQLKRVVDELVDTINHTNSCTIVTEKESAL
jgi:hypothetical protein